MTGRIACLLLVAAALAAAGSARAQRAFPYALETGREAALLGGAGAAFALGAVLDNSAPPLTAAQVAKLERARVPALDRSATRRWSPAADRASDYLVWTQLLAPVGQMVAGPGRERGGRLALIYAETLLLEAGVTYALKNVVARPRPFVLNDDPRIPDELRRSRTARRSFPSGHAANAFAAMVFFATTFERLQPDSEARGWVWGGCLASAAATGVLRYAAGRHYPTDILAGALIGGAAGWLVPRLHESVDDAGPGGGLKAAWGFAF